MASIIGVETLQHTNGTTAATIDSGGNVVLTQNKIAFEAKTTANITGYDGVSSPTNQVVFNDEKYDLGGNFDPTTGLFTAPVDGIYTFFSGAYADANILQLWPLVNDVRVPTFFVQPSGATASGSFIYKLNANDTVGIKVYTNTGSVTIYTNSVHTFFAGCLTLPL